MRQRLSSFRDVEDVAIHHLKSLDLEKVPGNERYLIRSRELMSAPRLAKKLREKYPQLKNRIPEGGDYDDWKEPITEVDVSKAEKVFGHQWKGAWESAEAVFDDIVKAGM
jgi:NADPH-dependent methylglyoxal reductase